MITAVEANTSYPFASFIEWFATEVLSSSPEEDCDFGCTRNN